METVKCPSCDFDSEVKYRHVMRSTDGPMEHLSIECVNEHRYLMPVEMLDYDIQQDTLDQGS